MAQIRIAYQTLRLMDERVQCDNGSAYRGWLQRVLPHLEDAYRQGESGFRSHLGASLLGQECPRSIYYDFRWTTENAFDGRMLRLFNRGHLEEGRIIALFLTIGCEIYQQDANGHQFRISWANGHAGGSGDGLVRGLPDLAIEQMALCEFKTHNVKSFTELAGDPKEWRKHLLDPKKNPFTGKGVKAAKFEHYVQMNLYMRKMGYACAAYVASCKDTDDIYVEIVVLDPEVADQFLARGEKIVYLPKPPTKINSSPGFWKCSWCSHKPVCHLGKAPAINCRTCEFSTPKPESDADGHGIWYCEKFRCTLTKAQQLQGCGEYARNREI